MLRGRRITIGTAVLAFLLALAALAPHSAAAKSAMTARLLSVPLPGAGHVYAGELSKGLEILGVWAGAASLAYVTRPGTWESKSTGEFSDLSTGTPTSTKLIFAGSAGVMAIAWLYAITDAPHGLKQVSLTPVPLEKGLGVAVALRF